MATPEFTENPDITKCSICQKEFNTPKQLPCLHTFCQPCLSAFINSFFKNRQDGNVSDFNCPVCMGNVIPPNAKKPHCQWAEQFPSNHMIITLIEQKKLKSKVKLCDPCKFNNNDVIASTWCFQCTDALCKECTNLHKGLKLTRNHELKNINEIKSTPKIKLMQNCEKHKDKIIEAFCYDHDQPCCTTCTTIHHRRCSHVTTLEEAASGVLESKDFADLLHRLSETSKLNQQLVKEKRKNIKDLENKKCDIQKELLDIRQQIIDRFDNLQSNFIQEFTRVHDRRVTEMADIITRVENWDKVIQNYVHIMKTCTSSASETCVFLEMKKVLQKEKELGESMKSVLTNHRCLEYLFKLDTDMEKLLAGFRSVGAVNVLEKSGVSTKIIPSLKNCQPRKITSFSTKDKCGVESGVYGGCFLPDDTLLLALCQNRTLARFSEKGDLIKMSNVLSGNVWDVTTIDSNTAVVTRPDEEAIDFVDIETLTVNETVLVNEYCYGIEYSDGKLYVGCIDKLLVLDKNGIKIHEIRTNNGGCIDGTLTIINGKDRIVVYTNLKTHSCHFARVNDFEFTELHTFKHPELENPRAVTSDRENNLYITGDSSRNVLQVSPDGVLIRVLISGFEHGPAAIHYSRDSDKFFVTYSYPALVNIYEMVTES